MTKNPSRCPISAACWRIVVNPVEIPKTSKSGFELPEETVNRLKYVRQAGYVLDIGPLAFCDDRFYDRNGVHHPACKVGDLVLFGMSSGSKVRLVDPDNSEQIIELRVLNDDEIGGILESEDDLIKDIKVEGAL